MQNSICAGPQKLEVKNGHKYINFGAESEGQGWENKGYLGCQRSKMKNGKH